MELRQPRVPFVVAFIAAAGLLAYLALAPSSGGTVPVAPQPRPAPLAAPPAEPASLGSLVPGFEGTLVAHLGQFGRMDAVQWPSRRAEPITIPVPQGIELRVDAGGRLFAGLGPAAVAGPGRALYTGPLTGLRPAAMDVVSAAFHGTDPGRLAWLELAGGGTRLWTGDVDPAGTVATDAAPVAAVRSDHRLVGWGHWGYLLAGWDPVEETWVAYLIDASGIERWRHQAVAAEVSSRGDVLLAHDAPGGDFRWSQVPAGSDGTQPIAADWVAAGAELGAGWSPDGSALAFVTPGGSGLASRVHIHLADGTPGGSAELPVRITGISWSHDGRFVLARSAQPEGRNAVFFVDTADWSVDEVGLDAFVQLASTRAGQH